MSIADYSPPERPPLRLGDAARPDALRRGRGMELVEEAGVAAIEAHVRGLVDRLSTGSTSLARPSRRRASPPARPAGLRAVDRRDQRSSRDARGRRRSSSRPARTRRGSAPPLQRRGDVDRLARGAHPRHRRIRSPDPAHGANAAAPRTAASRTATTPTRSRTSTSRATRGRAVACVVLVHGGFWRTGWDRTLMTPLAVDLAARDRSVERRVPRAGRRAAAGRHAGGLSGGRSIGWRASTTVESAPRSRRAAMGGGHLALWLCGASPDPSGMPAPVPGSRRSRRSPRQASATSTGPAGRPRSRERSRASSAHRSGARRRRIARCPRAARPPRNSSSTATRTTKCPSSQSQETHAIRRELVELEGVDHFEVIEPASSAWVAVSSRLDVYLGR